MCLFLEPFKIGDLNFITAVFLENILNASIFFDLIFKIGTRPLTIHFKSIQMCSRRYLRNNKEGAIKKY